MVAWSLIASVPIFLFYLRAPFLASRYLLDFGPAFAVAAAVFVFWCGGVARAYVRSRRYANGIVVTVFFLWWGWQVFTAQGAFDPAPVLTREQLSTRMAMVRGEASEVRLPDEYRAGMDAERAWPPFNAAGWDLETGPTRAAVTLFVPGVKELILEIAPAEEASLAADDYKRIQAKVGVEFLERMRIEETDEGRRLVFRGPKREIYRNGMQAAFLGFACAETVTDGDSDFRLLRVEWKEW